MARILITGSNGFVGRHLVWKLERTETLVLVDYSDDQIHHPKFRNIDVTRLADLTQLKETLDGIVHLAGVSRVKDGEDDPQRCININVMGTTNVLEFARFNKISPWIILGSTVEAPSNFYGLSKKLSEQIAEHYAKTCGLSIASLRFSNVYGSTEDNPAKLIPILIQSAIENRPIHLKDPEKPVNLLFIDDLVEGIRLTIKHLATRSAGCFESFDLCSAKSISVGELTKNIISIANSTSEVVHEKIRDIQVLGTDLVLPDPSRATKLLGYKAAINHKANLMEAIRRYQKR